LGHEGKRRANGFGYDGYGKAVAEFVVDRLSWLYYTLIGDTLMKVRDVVRLIERDGWVQIHQVGSHRQYKHPAKRGRVTVPGHMNDDVNPKTLKSVLRQAGLEGQT